MQSKENDKKVHNAGPLGVLLRSGQIKSINSKDEIEEETRIQTLPEKQNLTSPYFKTDAGVVFTEQELVFVNPEECVPWQYANRHEAEMGNIQELIQSIRNNSQLQPGLIRPHPKPYGNIRYEVIFGRRRHEACLQLKTRFLVILKEFKNDQDAIAYQDAENKFRKDISNYSNAILYKKLLDNKIFKNDSELAKKLGISKASLSELLTYSKIPKDIVTLLPNVHKLSISMALKITKLLGESEKNYSQILAIADQIGTTITSPIKLEQLLLNQKNSKQSSFNKTVAIKLDDGKKLFTFKTNHRGAPCITIDKDLRGYINHEELCAHLKLYLSRFVQTNDKSGSNSSKALFGSPKKSKVKVACSEIRTK